jgi:hypothetical protein
MGRLRGHHIPDEYNPFWEEHDVPDHEAWYYCGHEDGYEVGFQEGRNTEETVQKLSREVETLKELLSANVRVMKAEIKKELEEENAKQLREED